MKLSDSFCKKQAMRMSQLYRFPKEKEAFEELWGRLQRSAPSEEIAKATIDDVMDSRIFSLECPGTSRATAIITGRCRIGTSINTSSDTY